MTSVHIPNVFIVIKDSVNILTECDLKDFVTNIRKPTLFNIFYYVSVMLFKKAAKVILFVQLYDMCYENPTYVVVCPTCKEGYTSIIGICGSKLTDIAYI